MSLHPLRTAVISLAAGALTVLGLVTPAGAAPVVTADPTPTTSAAAAWNPPAQLVQPLDEVWRHVESTYPDLYGFRNYGWDQVMANKGRISYCVRWESDQPVSAQLRDEIHTALKRQSKKWTDTVAGFEGFPYQNVPVDIVGWAVKNRSTLQWTDNSVDIYTNVLDGGGAPQCAPDCGRFFHQNGDYSKCPGGAARHYDQSLWLTKGFQGGAGGDWGQRIGSEYMVGARGQEDIHILEHEIGHTYGLDDFYDWTPTGVGGFIMKAGSATRITEFDQWMYRDFWRHMKSRYGL
ncbi:hypothetical protein ACIQVO_06945 [Streptomyces sp. NPDC101062]|uniref:hypothetical protein n=1 Tax=unclassified Streptomyces TaxID=2593676 RepID=UPI002E763D9C|nr:hypothetical protein [Streptomyces sp. JV176]MEE1803451.1 hypothetical protein [Streptomyces sp. JV176]